MAQRAIPHPITGAENEITVNEDGTYTPTDGVLINAGGVAKFTIKFPTGATECYIPFGQITFNNQAGAINIATATAGGGVTADPDSGGTVKVGSK